MNIWKFEPQFWAFDRAKDQRYYWTNCYAWLQDESLTTPISSVQNALDSISWGCAPAATTRACFRVSCEAVGYDAIAVSAHTGSWSGTGLVRYWLHWAAFLRGYDASGVQRAYKRLRNWGLGDCPAGMLSDDLYSYVNNYAVLLSEQPLCSWSGVPIVSWTVDRALRPWQQRHGSKRAARPVYAIP